MVTSYVIIDDAFDFTEFNFRFIRTDSNIGITVDQAHAASEILNWSSCHLLDEREWKPEPPCNIVIVEGAR